MDGNIKVSGRTIRWKEKESYSILKGKVYVGFSKKTLYSWIRMMAYLHGHFMISSS